MSTEETDQATSEDHETSENPESKDDGDKAETADSGQDGDGKDDDGQAEEFELSDEGKEKVKQMQAAYDDDRETVALPGTDNTITGVAVNKWLDDDGNPKFGKDEKQDDADKQDADAKQDEADKQDADAHEDGDKQPADAS